MGDGLAAESLEPMQPHVDGDGLARLDQGRPVEIHSAVLEMSGHEDARLGIVPMGDMHYTLFIIAIPPAAPEP